MEAILCLFLIEISIRVPLLYILSYEIIYIYYDVTGCFFILETVNGTDRLDRLINWSGCTERIRRQERSMQERQRILILVVALVS